MLLTAVHAVWTQQLAAALRSITLHSAQVHNALLTTVNSSADSKRAVSICPSICTEYQLLAVLLTSVLMETSWRFKSAGTRSNVDSCHSHVTFTFCNERNAGLKYQYMKLLVNLNKSFTFTSSLIFFLLSSIVFSNLQLCARHSLSAGFRELCSIQQHRFVPEPKIWNFFELFSNRLAVTMSLFKHWMNVTSRRNSYANVSHVLF